MKRELAAVLTATTILSGMVGHVNAKTRYVTLMIKYHNDYDTGPYLVDGYRENGTYSYDKYGLLKKGKYISEGGETSFSTKRFFYDSHHYIKKVISKDTDGKPITFVFKTNKKGLITKAGKTTYTYNKNDQIINTKVKNKITNIYKYNKKGQIIAEGSPKQLKKNQGIYYYKYNKYGYATRANFDNFKTKTEDMIYQYKFKNGYPVKCKYFNKSYQANFFMNTYKYKKVKINTKYLKLVQLQQDYLTGKRVGVDFFHSIYIGDLL